MFYCKVQPRRSGKTTRLLSALILEHEWNKLSKQYDKFIVITARDITSKYIRTQCVDMLKHHKMISNICDVEKFFSDICFVQTEQEIIYCSHFDKTKYFIDEFTLCDNFIKNFERFEQKIDNVYMSSSLIKGYCSYDDEFEMFINKINCSLKSRNMEVLF